VETGLHEAIGEISDIVGDAHVISGEAEVERRSRDISLWNADRP
jgi:hypothetical protein